MTAINKILLCKCTAAHVIAQSNIDKLTTFLDDNNIAFDTIDDICKLASDKDPVLKDYANENTIIIACHPRAIRWLFAVGDSPLADNVKVLNLRTDSIESIIGDLKNIKSSQTESRQIPLAQEHPLPWFPVIDYSRCINCKQCMNFCLFGVYNLNDGDIEVANPTKCKPNCPACSRVCPSQAIIFPKYDKEPFNGSEPTEPPQPPKTNAVDIFTQLKQRNAKANLKAMQQELDIPEDVIKNLDHPDSKR